MKNIFFATDCSEIIARINTLTPNTQRLWGKMSVDQVLAHLNVPYEYFYENKYKKPPFLMKFILKAFVKKFVVNEVPYKANLKTGPDFIISSNKDFDLEKLRLISFINQTQSLGAEHFDGKESHSFGVLTSQEWNNMFYKHLDHHLKQFGA